MQPTDPSDAHLVDRAIELRALQSGVVALAAVVAMVFYPPPAVFALFGLAYLAYKFSYYADRIGVYAGDDRAVRHRRLEFALLATGAVTVASLVAIENLFADTWTMGGFLSLPPIDFTDLDALLADPFVPMSWAIVLAPAVAISYAGYQLRHRLLLGLDSYGAAFRATVWESIARLPVYGLWIAVLTMRPIYVVYRPAVEAIGGSVGLSPRTTTGFAVVLGDGFGLVVVGGLVAPAVVIATYLGVQHWKYEDATIPEVLGYPGIAPPTRSSHPTNVGGPIAVYLLYTLAVSVAISSLPLLDPGLLFGVAVSVLVGANVRGKTTILTRSVSRELADNFDAVVTGLVAGLGALFVFDLLVGSAWTFTELALTYPVVAAPLAQLANWRVGKYAVEDVSELVDRIEAGEDAVDPAVVDRLFVYSRAWDDALRATATDGLARLVPVTSYRREEAVDVFVGAVESEQPDIVRSGLRGIATTLDRAPTPETYERLIDAGCREPIVSHLDGRDEATRSRATEAAARLFAVGLDASDPAREDFPSEGRIDRMVDVASAAPEDRALADAVVEYFAAVWNAIGRSDDAGPEPTDEEAQAILGGLLRLSASVDESARLEAVTAVTADRAPADDERFSLAVDRLDAETDETRQMAAHVVRSGMEGRTDRIDPEVLVALLDDPAEPVRRAGARAIEAFVRAAPDRGPGLLDRLVFHLQENEAEPGQAEGSVLSALGAMDVEAVVDHPNASSTIARYVEGTRPPVAEPAARALSSLVEETPSVVREEAVGTAIEAGLTHSSSEVRLRCLEAVVAVVDESPAAGRRFVEALAVDLGARGDRGRLSAVCLAEVLESFPEDGLAVLPELSDGLDNLTPVDRQAVPFVVRGTTVSAVTVDVLARVVPLEPSRGEVLVEPLTDLGTSADGRTLEGILEMLAVLSAEFPAACRSAVGIAAAVLEDDRVGVRRAASEVLANVAAQDPAAVEPFVDRLVVATDDDSQRVRAAVLVALRNVCAASPVAIEADVHRVVGLLDDDSAAVRERAAHLIVVVAEQEPGVVEPAAETADRLRRLQRDPAVDFDPERLQNASTAIQTGAPVGEGEAADGDAEIWSPETADEMGVSGDTEVFAPGDDEFDAPEPAEPAGETTASGERTDPEEAATGTEGASPPGDGSAADVEDADTVVRPGEETSGGGDAEAVEDADTVVEPETGASGGGGGAGAVEDADTVVEPGNEASEGADAEDVGDRDTVVEPGGDASGGADAEDVEDADTVIESGDEASGGGGAGDVESLDTVVEPDDEASGGVDPGDVEDADTVIESGGEEAGDPDGSEGDSSDGA